MDFLEGFKMSWELLWAMLTADPKFTLTLGGVIIGLTAILILIEFLKNLKLKRSGMLEVDKMRGRRFEEYLRLLLVHRGYKVRLTPATGDYGADLILTLNDKTIIVQAKRYKKKVGLKAVQEIATAKSHYKANECWVITNNYFTKPAVELASSNKVRLIDRNQLMKWMLERNKSA